MTQTSFKKIIYFREREREREKDCEHESGGGVQRQRTSSRLLAEHGADGGLDLMSLRS